MTTDAKNLELREVYERYDFRLSPYLKYLLKDRGAADPLVRQFIPDKKELQTLPHEMPDPIGDLAHSPVAGIVHRYPDRVLLKIAHACPVYCRFCFRREMVGSHGEALRGTELDVAFDYLRAHPQIWEVILTGGDPLTLSARRLADVLERLAAIEHVSIIRIHTRVPLIEPESIDDALTRVFAEMRTPLYIALHVNHPDEITADVVGALARLRGSGASLLSQTVLLRGVNDDAAVLERLFRRLVTLKVKPYYLHHPDLAPGTSHFRVTIETGRELMRSLRKKVSGLCLPTYVLDIPGGFGKVPIDQDYVGICNSGARLVKDALERSHHYPE